MISIKSKSLKNIISNIGWLIFDRLFQLIVTFFVGIWVARYLGPEKFGSLNYVISFVSLFGFLRIFAPTGIIVREVVQAPEDSDKILGSAFIMALLGRGLLVLCSTLAIYFVRNQNKYFVLLAFIVSIASFIQSFDVIQLYFQANVKSRYIVIAKNVALILVSLYKIYLIKTCSSLLFFVLAILIESGLIAIGFIIAYHINGKNIMKWKIEYSRAFIFISKGWPMIIAGFFVTLYLKIDQIMLGQMLGDYSVGIYSVAVRISSLWYFLPSAIIQSVFPNITKERKKDEKKYYDKLIGLFTILTIFAYCTSIPMSVLSRTIVPILYGENYSEAGSALAVHVFASIFVFLGTARGVWTLNESHYKFALISNIPASIINILLNLLLIPIIGVVGAAWATLISYFVAYIGSGFFWNKTRKIALLQIRSILLLDFKVLMKLKELRAENE